MSNHHADNQSRNPLEDLSTQVTTDFARDLSSTISRDLSQHPEDALALMRAMSSSKDLPAGFASASDLFGTNGGGNCATDDKNCWAPADNYRLDSSANNPRFDDERAQVSSRESNKGEKIADMASVVASGIGDQVNKQQNNSDDGGSVWKTVGSIAMDVLPFIF